MPRYLWTIAVAEGRAVDVPIILPESMLAVGAPGSIFAFASERMDALVSAKASDEAHIVMSDGMSIRKTVLRKQGSVDIMNISHSVHVVKIA
jgi:hypothetical protein